MIYERLDRGCRAKVLAVTDDKVLLKAMWPASKTDEKRFQVAGGTAQNIVLVSRKYFKRRYGVSPDAN